MPVSPPGHIDTCTRLCSSLAAAMVVASLLVLHPPGFTGEAYAAVA